LVLGVWNDATQQYDTLPTTVDTTHNTLTATITHFSDFAPLLTTTPVAPVATPAPAASSGGGGNGAPVGSGGATNAQAGRPQIIYPDGRVVYLDEGNASAQTSGSGAILVGTVASGRFTANLRQGAKGADVKRLQQLLGVESSGNFGPLTRKAVEDFQVKYGIAKKGQLGFGELGPKTRAKIGSIVSSASSEAGGTGVASPNASAQVQTQSGTAAASTGTIERSLKIGSTGNDVKLLQIILNSDPDTRVAENGDGSSGKETTKVGALTVKAIQRLQVKYGIANPGDAGFGNVGPKTRTKINELLAALLVKNTAPAAVPAEIATTTSVIATSTTATSTGQ